MPRDKIIRMANQIAIFFESAAEGDAAEQTANHINQFWEPRMRKELFELAEIEPDALNPIVVSGIDLVRGVPKLQTKS